MVSKPLPEQPPGGGPYGPKQPPLDPLQPPDPLEQPPLEPELGVPLSQSMNSAKVAQPANENKSVIRIKERKPIFRREFFFNLCPLFDNRRIFKNDSILSSQFFNRKEKIDGGRRLIKRFWEPKKEIFRPILPLICRLILPRGQVHSEERGMPRISGRPAVG